MTGAAPAGLRAPGAAIGVDLGGTKTAAGLVLPGGHVELCRALPTPAADGAAAVVGAVLGLVAQIRADAAERGLPGAEAVGIGSAGVIDPRTGSVLAATDHIPGWAGTPLATGVAEATGLPTHVVNDVHAHALGEARYGAGRGLDTVLVVAAGTGLGGSIVVAGRPLTGAHGAAGHLGHVPAEEACALACSCGRTGHLEAVASGPGLLALYRRGGGQAADARDVVAAAAAGNSLAGDCVTRSGRALGRAIGGWVNTMDADVVVVTGGLAGAGAAWWAALRRGADEQLVDVVRSCPIVRSEITDKGAILGAAAFAERALQPPAAEPEVEGAGHS